MRCCLLSNKNDARLERLAEKIAMIVSLEGSLNIQCRKTNSDYVPFGSTRVFRVLST